MISLYTYPKISKEIKKPWWRNIRILHHLWSTKEHLQGKYYRKPSNLSIKFSFHKGISLYVCKNYNLYVKFCDLAPLAQFKKREKHPRRSVHLRKVAGKKPETLLKVTLLHGCFSRF